MLLDDREKQLFPISSYGISEEYLSKGPVFVKENQCAFSTGEPVFIDDMQNDPRVQYPEAAAKHGIVSMLSIPIKYKQETIGILRLYYDKPWKVHESDIDSLSVLCEHLGLVIEYHGLKNFLEGVKAAMGSLPLRRLEGL
jgi:transcriptional regulator with GAF, ATPase, and Fis domain